MSLVVRRLLRWPHFKSMIVGDKIEGRTEGFPPETIISFFCQTFGILWFRLDTCVPFSCVSDMFSTYGYKRFITDANTYDEALLVYFKLFNKTSKTKGKRYTKLEWIQLAKNWDAELRLENITLYAWIGEVISYKLEEKVLMT